MHDDAGVQRAPESFIAKVDSGFQEIGGIMSRERRLSGDSAKTFFHKADFVGVLAGAIGD